MTDDVRRFYDELAPEYDAIYDDWDATVQRDGALLHGLLGRGADPVLDVAAGMGTQAIGLALLGHRVVARDLSPALVARGLGEAARLGATLDFDLGDMCEARPGDAGRFGAVIAFGNALPHLERAALDAALRAAWLALRPGGRFLSAIRDYDDLSTRRPPLEPPRIMGAPPHRRAAMQLWTWDANGRACDVDLFVLREGPTGWTATTHRTRYHALLRVDLERAAAAAGFVDAEWLAPEQSGHAQPIFRARRAGGL
jgi:glycine/sarcosine N-methyltransferase